MDIHLEKHNPSDIIPLETKTKILELNIILFKNLFLNFPDVSIRMKSKNFNLVDMIPNLSFKFIPKKQTLFQLSVRDGKNKFLDFFLKSFVKYFKKAIP